MTISSIRPVAVHPLFGTNGAGPQQEELGRKKTKVEAPDVDMDGTDTFDSSKGTILDQHSAITSQTEIAMDQLNKTVIEWYKQNPTKHAYDLNEMIYKHSPKAPLHLETLRTHPVYSELIKERSLLTLLYEAEDLYEDEKRQKAPQNAFAFDSSTNSSSPPKSLKRKFRDIS